MLFKAFSIVAASLVGLASASTETVSLKAYGSVISGYNVFYGGGFAWIGYNQPDWLGTVSNITLTEDPTSTTTPWYINSVSGLFADAAYEMYIVPTLGSFYQVGFVATNSTNSTIPDGAVTTGFNWYGKSAAYVNYSDFQLQFWAVGTNTTGLWQMVWNAQASIIPVDNFPVVIKKTVEETTL